MSAISEGITSPRKAGHEHGWDTEDQRPVADQNPQLSASMQPSGEPSAKYGSLRAMDTDGSSGVPSACETSPSERARNSHREP